MNFFKAQIARIPGKKRITTNRAFILCPFHHETDPSGTISLDTTKPKFVGWFYCYGKCKRSAPWNEVAEKLGLKKINGYHAMPKSVPKIDVNALRESLLPEEEQSTKKDLTFFDMQSPKWRGFKREFLQKFGAKLCYDDKTGRFYLWFPVMVRGKEVGYFRAQIKPSDEFPNYLNSKGEWVRRRGLFPFDQAIRLMRRKGLRTLVLVEGQRDALRLLRAGIPAVCIMGTGNWTDDKMHIIESAGVKRLILLMDGDSPGKMATFGGKIDDRKVIGIYPQIKMHFEVIVFKLWRLAKKMGVKKVDPYDAPVILLHKLRKRLI